LRGVRRLRRANRDFDVTPSEGRAPRIAAILASYALGMCVAVLGATSLASLEDSMTLKRVVACVAVGATLILLACAGAIEPLAGTTECRAGQRFYNGRCRPSCTRHEDCPASARCLNVEGGGAICATPTAIGGGTEGDCVYLASDTRCVGVGTYVSYGRGGAFRGTYSSDPPGGGSGGALTNFSDPAFEPFTSSPYMYNPNDGCKGDATWTAVPASTNPGCGQKHTVRRCRLYGQYQCRLVEGTTVDRPNL
jgi:hypothetical protein